MESTNQVSLEMNEICRETRHVFTEIMKYCVKYYLYHIKMIYLKSIGVFNFKSKYFILMGEYWKIIKCKYLVVEVIAIKLKVLDQNPTVV